MATPDIYAEVKEWGLAIRAHMRIATNKLMNHYSTEERLAIRALTRVAPMRKRFYA